MARPLSGPPGPATWSLRALTIASAVMGCLAACLHPGPLSRPPDLFTLNLEPTEFLPKVCSRAA